MIRVFYQPLLCAIMFALVACTPGPIDTSFVAERWGEGMRSYDIQGVFPPRYVQPGDVYLVVEKATPGKDKKLWHRHSILLGRTDLRKAMQTKMTMSLSLPLTSNQNPKQSLFSPAKSIVALTPVGFGGVNVANITDADMGVSVPVKIFRAVFGGAAGKQLLLSISIPKAEDAEVGSFDAFSALDTFCNPRGGKQKCTFNNPAFYYSAWSLIDSDDDPNSVQFQVMIVTHVYYAREIDYSYSAEAGAALSAAVTLADVSGASPSKAASAPKVASAPKGASAPKVASALKDASAPQEASAPDAASKAATDHPLNQDEAYASQLADEAKKTIAALGVAGGSIQVVHVTSNGAYLQQAFATPVAVGIRGLWVTPSSGNLSKGDAK